MGTLARGIFKGYRYAQREARRESRELEREARRESRELERQQKYLQKLQELKEAAIEVWNWSKILSSKPPAKPSRLYAHENAAKDKLNEYIPSFLDKLLRRSETKRRKLASDVEKA
jgi:Sec-independent protein translocase protein TatA